MKLNHMKFDGLGRISVGMRARLESRTISMEVVADRLQEFSRLTEALLEFMPEDSLSIWLQKINKALNNLTPLEIIESGHGNRLWSMIFFLRSGVPS